MVTHIPKNGHPPFPGCSPTIPRIVHHHHLSFPRFSTGQSTIIPMMTNQHSQDSHPPSPFTGQSSTKPWMVIHHSEDVYQHPMDGHLVSQGWSTNQYPHDSHTPSPGRTTTNSGMVTISRIVNQKWSLTLAQPSLSCLFLVLNLDFKQHF